MLIDTHCHLDASEFDADRDAVLQRAAARGVDAIVIPAVGRVNFEAVRQLAHSFPGGCYALGIHPICMPQAIDSDLDLLARLIEAAMGDPRFIGIGEIGLDFFLPMLKEPDIAQKQERFYIAQLDLARRFELPVLLHVRRSQDEVLKQLRRHQDVRGIAHAFNGSFQQAEQFIDLGYALGFGGAMTFPRSLQIRRLATQLPLDALVLETDAPDIPPAWLGAPGQPRARNEPGEVSGVADALAELRGLSREEILAATARNARRVIPRIAAALAKSTDSGHA